MNELDLFAAAIKITSPSQRAGFLDRECAGENALRQRLDELLAAHVRSHRFLDRSPRDLLATEDSGPTVPIGTIIDGRYKLLEEIGDGGIGTVWMAEQTKPIKRLVAVKLIKAGMDSKAVLARFEAERQALAMMDHPNIAKVLDGGTTDSGHPFFVMELVKGLPLTEYCDARKLSVNERLDLFVQICSAVQHAHQKAVIHRDLKPTNVLVTEHDGKPIPKVIDFGLAKALNASQMLTDRTLHTAYGTVVGTPLYMAPEQVGINALDVDTRTDIYALGVILYELLTGTTPLEKARFKEAAWEEVKRLIREEEPPRPSTRLSSDRTLPSLAASRQVDAAKLPGMVRGELDWIVMKALEKDRSRRYETANALSKDLHRFLAGDTVEACPPTWGYRLRKTFRRHKTAILTTSSFAAVLLVATAVSLAFGVMARQSAQNATMQRTAAEASRAEAVGARADAERQRDNFAKANQSLEASQLELRSSLYASVMSQIATAWDSGEFARVSQLLSETTPKPGEPDSRGFEWHYWQRQRHSEVSSLFLTLPTLPRSVFQMNSHVTFSPNGRFAVSTTDGVVWNATSGTRTGNGIPQLLPLATPALSPDGRRMLAWEGVTTTSGSFSSTSNATGRLTLFDTASRKKLADLCESVTRDQTTRSRTVLRLLANSKVAGAFSPDGQMVATLAPDSETLRLRIHDAATGKQLLDVPFADAQLRQASGCRKLIEYSPDGKELAVVAESGTEGELRCRIQILDATTGKESRQIQCPLGEIETFIYAPDGQRIVAFIPAAQSETGKAGEYRPGQIICLDAANGQTIWSIPTGESLLQVLAMSPDRRTLAGVAPNSWRPDYGATIQLWDVESGQALPPVTGLTEMIGDIAFLDSERLSATCTDLTVKVWRISKPVGARIALGLEVWRQNSISTAMGSNGLLTAAITENRSASGRSRGFNPATNPSTSPAPSTESALKVFTADGSELHRIALPDQLRAIPSNPSTGLQFSPGGQRLMVFSEAGIGFGRGRSAGRPLVLQAFDVSSGNELARFEAKAVLGEPVWSGDGERIALVCGLDLAQPSSTPPFGGGFGRLNSSFNASEVVIFDAGMGRELTRFRCDGELTWVCLNHDGSRLVTYSGPKPSDQSASHQLHVLNTSDGTLVRDCSAPVPSWTTPLGAFTYANLTGSRTAPTANRTRPKLSPDGRWLCARTGQTFVLIDLESDVPAKLLRGISQRPGTFAFTGDSQRLVTCGALGTPTATRTEINLWDVRSGRVVLSRTVDGPVLDIHPDKDDSRLHVTTLARELRSDPSLMTTRESGPTISEEAGPTNVLKQQILDASPLSVEEQARDYITGMSIYKFRDFAATSSSFGSAGTGTSGTYTKAEWQKVVRDDTGVSEPVRAAALRLIDRVEEQSDLLNNKSWAVVQQPGKTVEDYKLALAQVEQAVRSEGELTPANYLNTLGVAQYRCGQYDKAIPNLTKSLDARGGMSIVDVSFLAMAHHQLGHREEAARFLSRARQLQEQSDERQRETFDRMLERRAASGMPVAATRPSWIPTTRPLQRAASLIEAENLIEPESK